MYFCYILRNTDDKYKKLTYNGYTTDPFNRLRCHNGEICGGAKYTHNKGIWEIYVLLTGFKDNHNALSCEWRIKHPTNSRIRPKKYCGIEGRVKSLNEILLLNKWTSKCQYENNKCNYTLYIVEDMAKYIDESIIPANIKIIKVPKIDENYVKIQLQ
jgi:predicted GIY-YIG superfamily endonuclease